MESLTIDGEENFSNGDRFDKNAKITVSYHTFPEKNESAIEAPETEVPKTEAPKEVTVEDYTEVNRLINESLLLSQGWALGKLDGNGNPTENGTPNAAFAFSLYVYNIEYLGAKLRVTVDPSFMQLSDAEKTAIANDVQGSVYSLTNNRPYTTFFVNGNAIGNSKITDSQSFKWD